MPEKTEKEKIDLHEYQQKIIQRLIDKRRQNENQRKQWQEEEKIQERAFRVEWKAIHKEKTNEKIASQVDNAILKNSITRHPDIILRLNRKMAGDLVDSKEQSLSGLLLPADSMNLVSDSVKEESFLLTKRHDIVLSNSSVEGSEMRKAFQLQTKSTSALGFLQKTATFNLSINSRIRGNALNGRQVKAGSALPHELSFSSYDKASQANDMMWGLVGDTQFLNPTTAAGPNSVAATPAKDTPMRRASCENLTKIRTVGLMAQFLNDGSNAGTAAAYNWQGADFLSPMQRTQSFINNYLGASKPGSISVGPNGIVGGTPGPILPSATPGNAGAGGADAAPVEGHSAMYCSMADTVFLIGPTKRTIYDFVPIKPLRPVEGRHEVQETTKVVVDPSILFMTECDNPAEMLSLLPSYCFPSGVDLTVQPNQVPSPPPTSSGSQSRVLMRKTSMTLPGASTPPTPQTGKSSSKSKKLKAFFPSDFSMMETGAVAVASAAASAAVNVASAAAATGANLLKSNTAANASVASPAVSGGSTKANAAATKNAPFVLMFGDHTYQQYCLGLQLPMTFLDNKNDVIIHTSYVVCFMTKLPLFNYMFHILEQFEILHRGYQFSEPFPMHDENFAIHPDLRLLSEFAARLKKMTVPLFPYLIPSLESYKRTGHQKLLAEHPDLLTTEDYNAVLPDIEFLFVNKANPNAKIDIPFRRSMYQSFFSSIAAEYNPFNLEQTKVINAHKTAVNKFIATSTHRSEREKEDTYMILLWALPVLLRYLPLDQIILALGCAVTEMRIVVKHKDFHVISSVILALIYLLKPLKWCSPVIVILPDNLAEFIESPVPIIIGLQKLPDNFVLLERFVVIDPQERIVHLNPTDVVMAHTILLPHAPKLVNVLTAPRETILRLTKRKKNPKLKKTVHLMMPMTPGGVSPVLDDKAIEDAAESQFPSKFEDAASVNGRRRKISINTDPPAVSSSSPEPASIMSPQMPLPVELDIGTSDNNNLLSAVKTFSTLVSNHIEAIINTAIHMQHDEKMKARAKRTLLSGGDKPKNPHASLKTNSPNVSSKKQQQKALMSSSDSASPTAAAIATANLPQNQQSQAAVEATAPSIRRDSMHKSYSDPSAILKPSPVHSSLAKASSSSGPSGASTAAPALAIPSSSSEDRHKSADHTPSGTNKIEELVLTKENLMECSTLPPLSPFRDSPTSGVMRQASLPENRKRSSSEPGSPNDPLRPLAAVRKSLGNHDLPGSRRPSPDVAAHRRVSPHATADTVGHKRSSPHNDASSQRKSSPHGSRMLKSTNATLPKPTTPQSITSSAPKPRSPKKPASATNASRITKVLDAYETTKQRNKEFAVDRDGHIKKDIKRDGTSHSPVRKRIRNSSSTGTLKSVPEIATPAIVVSPTPASALAPIAKPVENEPPAAGPPSPLAAIPSEEPPVKLPSPRAAKSAYALEDVPDPTVISVDRRHTEPLNAKILSSAAEKTVSPLSERTNKSISPELDTVPEFADDNADNESTSDDPSIASTSSSLPSLRLNAPVMAMKEIGQGGAKFVAQLVETQMYCNYCQNLKVEAAALAAINSEKEALQGMDLASHSEDHGPIVNIASDAVLKDLGTSFITPKGKVRALSRTRSASMTSMAEECIELDAITSVFDVMLSGTVSMDIVTINIEVNRYRELYGETDYSKNQEVYASYEGHILDRVRGMSTSIGFYSDDCHSEQRPMAESEAEDTPPSPVTWCNGLVCRGLCNTSMCTPICVQLWQSNVQKLRHQAVLEEIVMKRHHSDLVMKKHRITDRTGPGVKPGVVKVSLKPQLEAIKHPSETQSQYEQRKAIIKASSITEKEKQQMAKLQKQQSKTVKPVRITGPKIVDASLGKKTKKCAYATSATADPATMLIAKYYAEKQSKILVQRRKKAMRIVKRFLQKFVRLYRKFKFFDCVVRVQAFVRGYIIRCYIPSIVEALIARKTERLLACIRIRNYIRRRVVQILKKRAKIKNAELMKKRAALSLPVRSTSPMLARVASPPAPDAPSAGPAGVKSPQTAANTRKVLPSQIIQDGGDGEGGFVSQLYNKAASRVASPLRVLGGVRGASPLKRPSPSTATSASGAGIASKPEGVAGEPSPPVTASSARASDRPAPPVLPSKSRSVNFDKPASTMETLFGKMGDDKRRESLKADTTLIDKLNAGYETALRRSSMASAASNEEEDGEKKHSKRTYSEKAMDFLHIGKILKRSGSTGKKRSSLFNLTSGRNSGTFFSNDASSSGSTTSTASTTGSITNEKKLSRIQEVRSDESLPSSEKMPGHRLEKNSNNDSNRSISEKELDPITSANLSDDGTVRNVPSVVSPTSGIPVFNCDYSSDEEDKKRAPLPKRNSKAVFGNQKKNSLLARSIINSGFISEVPSESFAFSLASEFSMTPESSEHMSSADMSSTGSSSKEPYAPVVPVVTRPPKDRRELMLETHLVNSTASVELNTEGLVLEIERSMDYAEVPTLSQPTTGSVPAAPARSADSHVVHVIEAPIPRASGSFDFTESATTDSIIPTLHPPVAPQSKRRHSSTGVVSLSATGAFDFKKASPINRYAAQNNYDLSKIVNVAHLESKNAHTPPQNTLSQVAAAAGPSPPALHTPRKMYFQRRSVSPKPGGRLLGSGSGSGPEADSLSGDDKSSPESKRSPTPNLRLSGSSAPATLTPLKDLGSSDSKDITPNKPKSPTSASAAVEKVAGAQQSVPTSNAVSSTSNTAPVAASAAATAASSKKDGTPPKIPTKEGDGSGEKKKPSPGSGASSISQEVAPTVSSIAGNKNTGANAGSSGTTAVPTGKKTVKIKIEESESSESEKSSEEEAEEEEFDEEDAMCQAQDVSDSLTETLKTAPLKTLGKACLEVLNRQQLQTLKTMWSMLRNGVAMLKHGRNGKPKFKALFCDVNMTKLYWRSPGSKADPDQDDSDVEIDTLFPGSVVPKNRHHKHSRRTTTFTKTDADRVILFREILEVRDDCSTEVMKRSAAKSYLGGAGARSNVISIVMDDRTLDFEIDESKWGSIYHALQILVMYYHAITPGRYAVPDSSHGYPKYEPQGNGSSSSDPVGQPQAPNANKPAARPSYPFATISYDSDPQSDVPPGDTDGTGGAGGSSSYIGQNKTIFTNNKKKNKAKRMSLGSNASDS